MIANPNIKLCPFRKKTETMDYRLAGSGGVLPNTEEYFLECLEKQCMAWSEKERRCLLMNKEAEEKK